MEYSVKPPKKIFVITKGSPAYIEKEGEESE